MDQNAPVQPTSVHRGQRIPRLDSRDAQGATVSMRRLPLRGPTGEAGGIPRHVGKMVGAVDDFDQLVAVALAVASGMYLSLGYGVSLGLVLVVAATPVWAASAFADKRLRYVLAIVLLAIVWGLVLFSFAPHRSLAGLASESLGVLSVPLIAGALIWVAKIVGVERMTLYFALGSVLGIPFSGSDQGNAWRFTYSIPITLLLLAWTGRRERLWSQIGVLLVLAAVGMLNDSRSNTGFLLLAAAVILVQRLFQQQGSSRLSRGLGIVALVTAFGFALYQAVISAILGGDFGLAAQQRTQAQIDSAGSLLLGGRPELAASFALLMEHPLGVGPGVRASLSDIRLAKQAMWDIGYDPNNGYVGRYMFGSGYEVHSTMGDMWLRFGLAGAVLVLVLAWLNVAALMNGLVRGMATGLFVYLVIRSFWDLAVSPFSSAAELMPLVLALALMSPRGGAGRVLGARRVLES